MQIPEDDEIDPNAWGPDYDPTINPTYALGMLAGMFGALFGLYQVVKFLHKPSPLVRRLASERAVHAACQSTNCRLAYAAATRLAQGDAGSSPCRV